MPTKDPGPLVWLGPEHDGGYPVTPATVSSSDTLLSMGLNDDWRFEEAFHRKTGARVLCFDHTVTPIFWAKRAIFGLLRGKPRRLLMPLRYRQFFASPDRLHRRQMIGYDGPGSISLRTILSELDGHKIFLKCDIEGGEYRIMGDIIANQRRFTAIVMECHDVDLQRDRIDSFVRNLTDFALVRTHANNYGSIDPDGDPMVLEFTFTRREFLNGNGDEGQRIIERQNNPSTPGIELVFQQD